MSISKSVAVAAIAVAAGLGAQAAVAQTRGQSATGLEYLTGGVSIEELRAMERERARFSFWLTTAAKGSGAHLSDARITIVDARKQAQYEGVMDGPWLMVALPPGRYTLNAQLREQTQSRAFTVAERGRREMVMYFDSPAQVSDDWVSPFKGGKPDGGAPERK